MPSVRGLVVGPRESALRVGVPVVLTVMVLAAASTLVYLETSDGGVFFPADALFVAAVASALYAARYRALGVCVVVGVAALAGSDVGFHVLHGDQTLVATLWQFAGDPVVVGIGAVVGLSSGVAGLGLGAAGRRLVARERAS